MPSNTFSDKAAFRKEVRSHFPGTDIRCSESEAICKHIIESSVYASALTVFAFFPLPREADIKPVLRSTLAAEKRLALPRCGQNGEMSFHLVSSLDMLVNNRWGIPEPTQSAPVLTPSAEDLILVPLEAIGADGRRLGKGGGYYDRYLAKYPCIQMGIALHYQLVPCVPHDSWDIILPSCCTPDGIISF